MAGAGKRRPVHWVLSDGVHRALARMAASVGPRRSAPIHRRLVKNTRFVPVFRPPPSKDARTEFGLPVVFADSPLDSMDLEAAFDPDESSIPVLELALDVRHETADDVAIYRLLTDMHSEGRGQGQIPPAFTEARDAARTAYRELVLRNPAASFVDMSPLDYGNPLSAVGRAGISDDALYIIYQKWLADKPIRTHFTLHCRKQTLTEAAFCRALAEANRGAQLRIRPPSVSLVPPPASVFCIVQLGGGPPMPPGKLQLAAVGTGISPPAPVSEAEEAFIPGPIRHATGSPTDPAAPFMRAIHAFPKQFGCLGARVLEAPGAAAAVGLLKVRLECIVVDGAGNIQCRGGCVGAAIGTVYASPGRFSVSETDISRELAARCGKASVSAVAAKSRVPMHRVARALKRYGADPAAETTDPVRRTLAARKGPEDPLVPASAKYHEACGKARVGIDRGRVLPVVDPGVRTVFGRIRPEMALPLKSRTKPYTDVPETAQIELVPNIGGAGVNHRLPYAELLAPFLKKSGGSRDLRKLTAPELFAELRQILEDFSSREGQRLALFDVRPLLEEIRTLLRKKKLGRDRYSAVRLIQKARQAVDYHPTHDQTSCGPQKLRAFAARLAETRALFAELRALNGGEPSRITVPRPDDSRPFGFSYVRTTPRAEWNAMLDRPVRVVAGSVVVFDTADLDPSEARPAAYAAWLLRKITTASLNSAVLVASREAPPADETDRAERIELEAKIWATVDLLRSAVSPETFRLVVRRFKLLTE